MSQRAASQAGRGAFSIRLDGFEFSSLCGLSLLLLSFIRLRQHVSAAAGARKFSPGDKIFQVVARSLSRAIVPALKYWTALSCSRIFFVLLLLLLLLVHPLGAVATFHPYPLHPCHPPSLATFFFFSPASFFSRSRPLPPPLSNLLPSSSLFFVLFSSFERSSFRAPSRKNLTTYDSRIKPRAPGTPGYPSLTTHE